MKVKVSTASGPVLDWMAQEAEYQLTPCTKQWVMDAHRRGDTTHPYSAEWVWGGPIIEREKVDIYYSTDKATWAAAIWKDMPGGGQLEHKQTNCPTPLVAAMRCLVSSKLGEEVEVPDELA